MSRHSSVQHLVDLLDPRPDRTVAVTSLGVSVAALRDDVLDRLGDGPELSAGLRKLLEAKDCFVRQAMLDQRGVDGELLPKHDTSTVGYRGGGPNG